MTDVARPPHATAGGPDGMPRVTSSWLGLREAADAAARSAELVELARDHLARRAAGAPRTVIHDLGCGTGSMGRWLAPRLAGPQHWIMCDRDADLLERAAAGMVDRARDGAPVTVETRQCDVTRLTADDFAGAGLVTSSALLDLLSLDEVERIAAACAGAGTAALMTLSVVGRVHLTPADALDGEIAAAFNAHQRRTVGDRRLLGPDAVDATAAAFARQGAVTVLRPSPWRLGAGNVELLTQWLSGWLDAACEQRPELAGPAAQYARRRLAEAAHGRLGAEVQHHDLLAGWA